MKILVTGATGFVGRALSLRLQRDGHQLVVMSRNPLRAHESLGTDLQVVSTSAPAQNLRVAFTGVDAVINLAGEAVVGKRWSASQRARLRESRVDFTRQLVRHVSDLALPPSTLISASAVGFYGTQADTASETSSEAGRDFLAKLCADWEHEAMQAQAVGTRVVTLRTGIVLGAGGGALPRLLPIFRMGLGGRLGNGRQSMPWIHIQDVVEIIVQALHDSKLRGPINLVSPKPVDNRAFTEELAMALGKPALVPVPAALLRIAMGKSANVLLGGQNALPSALLARGFEFQFPTLRQALADLVQDDMGCTITSASDLPDSEYLRHRRPHHELRQQTLIRAP